MAIRWERYLRHLFLIVISPLLQLHIDSCEQLSPVGVAEDFFGAVTTPTTSLPVPGKCCY